MPKLISDNGQEAIFDMGDGTTRTVASELAPDTMGGYRKYLDAIPQSESGPISSSQLYVDSARYQNLLPNNSGGYAGERSSLNSPEAASVLSGDPSKYTDQGYGQGRQDWLNSLQARSDMGGVPKSEADLFKQYNPMEGSDFNIIPSQKKQDRLDSNIASSFGIAPKAAPEPNVSQYSPVGSSASSANQPAPEAPSSITREYDAYNKANQMKRDADIAQARAELQVAKDTDQYLKDRQAEEKRNADIQQSAFEKDNAVSQELSKKFAASEIQNPWAKADTGTKITSALAIGLGALGSAITGGPNYALQIIDKAINDDLNIQTKNMEKTGQAYQMQRQYVKDVQDNFTTQSQKRLMLQQLYLEAAKAKLDQFAAKNKELMAGANYQEINGKLIGAIENTKIARAKGAAEAIKTQAEASALMNNPSGMKSEQFVPGIGYAYAAKDAEDLRGLKADVEGAQKSVDRLLTISNKSGKSLLPGDIAEADGFALTLQGLLRNPLVGPGAVNDNERKLMENVIRNPTRIFSLDSSNKKALSTLMESLAGKIDSKAQASVQGYKPGSYKLPKLRTEANGAQYQIVNGRAIPVNKIAEDMAARINASKMAQPQEEE